MVEQLVTEAASRLSVSGEIVSALLREFLSLLMNERTGGPEGFINLFRRAGIGDVITSWYGDGQGKAITPACLQEVLGTAEVDKLAAASGLSPIAASAASAVLLPKLIGRLTPNGILPSSAALSSQIASDCYQAPALPSRSGAVKDVASVNH